MDFNQFSFLGTFVTPEGECIWGMSKRSYCRVAFASGAFARFLGFTGLIATPQRLIDPRSNQPWQKPGSWGWYRHKKIFQTKVAVEEAAKRAAEK